MIVKKRTFPGSACERVVYNVQDGTGSQKPGRSRFKNEAEREAHRKELARRKIDRRLLRRQLLENHGPQFEVVGPVGVVVNPHEMKIKAILIKETRRMPIVYTMPIRSGGREFRRRLLGKFQLPEISFTDKSDP